MIKSIGAVNSFGQGEEVSKKNKKAMIATSVAVGAAALGTAAYLVGGKVSKGTIAKLDIADDSKNIFKKAYNGILEGLKKFNEFTEKNVVSKVKNWFKKADKADDAAGAAAKTGDEAASAAAKAGDEVASEAAGAAAKTGEDASAVIPQGAQPE